MLIDVFSYKAQITSIINKQAQKLSLHKNQ